MWLTITRLYPLLSANCFYFVYHDESEMLMLHFSILSYVVAISATGRAAEIFNTPEDMISITFLAFHIMLLFFQLLEEQQKF